jgi:hypothetical protein
VGFKAMGDAAAAAGEAGEVVVVEGPGEVVVVPAEGCVPTGILLSQYFN